MDASCLPVLLRVTTGIMTLAERAQAGDERAREQVAVLAELLERRLS